MNHELKIHPQYFCRVEDGTKTFEVRENDRGFQPGDVVNLREWDPTVQHRHTSGPFGNEYDEVVRGYTGKELSFRVGYVLPIDASRVVFSLLPSEVK